MSRRRLLLSDDDPEADQHPPCRQNLKLRGGGRSEIDAQSLLCLVDRDDFHPASRWVWQPGALRVPPSEQMLAACGFSNSVWAPHVKRDAPNMLLLLHGLGALDGAAGLHLVGEELTAGKQPTPPCCYAV